MEKFACKGFVIKKKKKDRAEWILILKKKKIIDLYGKGDEEKQT